MLRHRATLAAVMWLALTAATATWWTGCGDDDDTGGANGTPTPVGTPDGTPTPVPPGECQTTGGGCSDEMPCCEGLTCVGGFCLG